MDLTVLQLMNEEDNPVPSSSMVKAWADLVEILSRYDGESQQSSEKDRA